MISELTYMIWLPWALVLLAPALAVAGLYLLSMRYMLNKPVDRYQNRRRVWIRKFAMTIRYAALACLIVGVYGLLQRPALPPGTQPLQNFEVLVGCDAHIRTEMPTVLEQGVANARCLLVPLLAFLAPECGVMTDHDSEKSQQESYAACYRGIVPYVLWWTGQFLLGYLGVQWSAHLLSKERLRREDRNRRFMNASARTGTED